MNKFPYTHAHIMVVPKRHVDRLEKLNAAEQEELMALWVKAQTTIQEALSPQGVNLGMNIGQAAGAGIEDHLHAHIVPRWVGDTNFMPMLADSRIMPEHLKQTYLKLKKVFNIMEVPG
jgi:ATP adenylyltransferase